MNNKPFNPWENTKTFIQNTGSLDSFIDFLDAKNIENCFMSSFDKDIINSATKTEEEINSFYILNDLSKNYYDVLF